MERGLVVIQGTDTTEELLQEAGEYAAGTERQLLLLSFISEEEYEADVEALNRIGDVEDVSYQNDAVLDAVERETDEAAAVAFDEHSIEYGTIVAVTDEDEHASRVLEAAAEHDCDHVFMVGQGRSPTGKALFGDQLQHVILNFDGFVTVTVE